MANPSINSGQKCLACGTADAVSAEGTVPLCGSCASLAKESKRGVKYEKPEDKVGSV